MEALFLKVLSMSATAAVVILVVLLARLLLRRAPKVFSYALWAVVLFRLLCPFTIQIPWSLTPSIQVEPAGEGLNMVEINMERVEVVIRVDDSPTGRPGSIPSDGPAEPSDHPDAAVQAPSLLAAVSIVWLTGAAILLGYSALSLLRLRQKLVGSAPLEGEKNVRLADHIPSPFVLGLFRPNIYLPSDLPEGERDYVLLHERTHIRRRDHLFRTLAWLALAIHWFNPLVWLAFHLAGKDMEMSCDETVLRKMGRDVRADYSSSLLRLSAGKRLPAGPLAFGDGDPTSRIKNVLSYKKPALWVIVIALIGVLCAGVALATDRMVAIRDSDFPAFDPDSVTADLTFSLEDVGTGPLVRIAGTAGGVELSRVVWRPEGLDTLFGEHLGGELSMAEYKTDSWGAWVTAWWTDEGRTSVTVSTLMSAMLSSQSNVGWWEFTVDLGSGTVTSMNGCSFREGYPDAETYFYPEAISDEEAVKAARIAAKLLTAAEDYYNNVPVQADAPDFPVLAGGDAWMEVLPGTVTPTGLTYQIHNETQSELMYGNPYGLQVEDGGVWHGVDTSVRVAFTTEGYILPGNASASKTINWSYAYGELPPGHYRVTTKVHLEPGREDITLTAEFEIEG
ncbi:MAG: hypothetical protein HDT33_06390 [Clostridiales bacterium]|nr:hypothetical protein [Clostridiales bacterium]